CLARQELNQVAIEVQLHASNDLGCRDHVHATRQPPDDVDAERLGPIVHIAVVERQRPGLPAAAVVAASQRTDGVNELVMRIRGEMRRLAAAGDDDAWTMAWRARR